MSMREGTTLALDTCEWDQESYCLCYSFSKEATICTIEHVCRTMATPGDGSVKEQRSRQRRDDTSGGVTGHSGSIGTESAGGHRNSTKSPFG